MTQHISLYDYIYTPRDEVYETIKKEMGWEKSADAFEHLDCELHDIPFYIQTLKLPGVTTGTLYNSGLIRQGIMTREEAMKIEDEKLKNPQKPHILDSFLKEIKMNETEFTANAKEIGKPEKYKPKLGVLLRKIYHKKRRY